ncbi:MAG: PAS domain-containing protein [Rhodospirillaceae bacterium]|nr:PAS domain-containing protein [Rhodospirillales bacterium]
MEDDLSQMGTPAGLPRAMLVGFLDAVPASAAILDIKADIVAVNMAWRRFAADNCGPADPWLGLNYLTISETAEDSDARAVCSGLRAILSGELMSFDHDYPCNGNGFERWFRCLVSPLEDESHTIIGAAVMHLDITAEKLAECRATAASRTKSEFLASLSHELRTPLNAIIGFSEMLMMEFWGPLGDSHYKEYAGDIHAAGKHLLSLINEVLDLSKVEAGRFELHDELVALPEVARQCLTLVAARAARSNLALELDMDEDMPPLRADARVLRQILLNLLSNAIKFTPPGGSVTTSAALTPEGWLAISVTDTGIGIAAEDFERVLEPFGQVDSELARQHSAESTGLGLPLCRRFVELHGGVLNLKSAPGQGSTLSAMFPPERMGPQRLG